MPLNPNAVPRAGDKAIYIGPRRRKSYDDNPWNAGPPEGILDVRSDPIEGKKAGKTFNRCKETQGKARGNVSILTKYLMRIDPDIDAEIRKEASSKQKSKETT